MPIIAANWSATREQHWRGYGFSEIIDRDGQVVSCAHSLYGSEIVFADLPVDPPKRPAPSVGGLPDTEGP